uniref:Sodium-coupled monocarboxylate transporter 1 n=1 Tax=Lygus hesperus TaxID=30085 RepID=A0A0K8T529_LYGHE
MSSPSLPWIEYVVVAASLIGTTGVGLYFSKSGKGSLEDYMFGGKRMTVLPITLSITATMMSANVLVGGGQEVYLHGSQTFAMMFPMAAGSLFGAYFYLPILYALDSVSPFEFFDRRYNSKVRKVISAINVFDTLQLIIMSIYVPALTFSQACGISPFKIACVLSVICFIYTVSGGLKAVAWADSFQMMILIFCTIFFFTVGLIKAGGVSEVWRLNDEGYRMELFNFDPSPFQRTTFWTCSGIFFMWAPYFLSASQHQRFKSLPSHDHAKKVILLSMILMISLTVLQYSIGLLAYAYFAGCDPVLAKKEIHSHSTIIPYFVSQIAVNHPGMTGLFHADIIAAGLSTTTSLWNTLSCTIYEDLIRPFMKPVSEKKAYRIIIGLVVILAVVTTSLTKGVEYLGTVVEATVILRTTTQAAIFVLFNAGMFLPWVNSKGIISGGLTAASVSLVVLIGNVSARRSGLSKDLPKFLTTEKCEGNFTTALSNATLTLGVEGYGSHSIADDSVFWLFKLSFWYYQVPGKT